jgi:tetratricopeptide (TPR) repeat protein
MTPLHRRWFAVLVLGTLAPLAVARAESATEAMARGDAAWERRAEGHQGGKAAPGPIGEAVAAYGAAAKADPTSLEAHWKLMRALWFQGDYATAGDEAKKAVFARGREVGDAAFALLAARPRSGPTAGVPLADLKPAEAAAAFAAVPEAKAVYFWAAVNWGLWGEVFGKLAAARQGVAGRIRNYSETVIALDERFEQAGGHRVLGRLHARAPSIIFVTGWIDRDKAIAELRRAVALAPDYLYNRLYLAEALAEHRPGARVELRRLLEDMLRRTPDPSVLVEDERNLERARALLAEQ